MTTWGTSDDTARARLLDEQLIANLIDGCPAGSNPIRPDESLSVRLVVLLTSPIWIGAAFGLCLVRLVRGRLPLVVVHQRVGFGRSKLWTPKIATAAVAVNERRLFGLIEIATGGPVPLEVPARFEHWLRETGLDELPQFALIGTGRMRLVGPRPVTAVELDEMLESGPEVGIDHLHPGLIGLWQVLDRHGYLLPERRDLDMLMVQHWSPLFRRRLTVLAIRQAVGRLRPSLGGD